MSVERRKDAAAIIHRVNNWDRLCDERDELRAAVRDLINALPRCQDTLEQDECPNWATHRFVGGYDGPEMCDKHARTARHVREHDTAEPLRRVLALLEKP